MGGRYGENVGGELVTAEETNNNENKSSEQQTADIIAQMELTKSEEFQTDSSKKMDQTIVNNSQDKLDIFDTVQAKVLEVSDEVMDALKQGLINYEKAQAEKAASETVAEKIASSGTEPRPTQQLLKNEGLYDGEIDGFVGPLTEEAFNKMIDENVTYAVADENTESLIDSGAEILTGLKKLTESDFKKMGFKEITLIQQALTDAGYNVGKVDGDFGPNTRAGINEFKSESVDNHTNDMIAETEKEYENQLAENERKGKEPVTEEGLAKIIKDNSDNIRSLEDLKDILSPTQYASFKVINRIGGEQNFDNAYANYKELHKIPNATEKVIVEKSIEKTEKYSEAEKKVVINKIEKNAGIIKTFRGLNNTLTVAEMKVFQYILGVTEDGNAGPDTWSAYRGNDTIAKNESGRSIEVNSRDMRDFAAMVKAEAGMEGRSGKVAVGHVIMNRVTGVKGVKGKSLNKVLYAKTTAGKSEFSPMSDGTFNQMKKSLTSSDLSLAKSILDGKETNPIGTATFFQNLTVENKKNTWQERAEKRGKLQTVATIGNHRFRKVV